MKYRKKERNLEVKIKLKQLLMQFYYTIKLKNQDSAYLKRSDARTGK